MKHFKEDFKMKRKVLTLNDILKILDSIKEKIDPQSEIPGIHV